MPDQETPSESNRFPDVRTIRYLVRLMQRYDLTAIDLSEGTTKIRLRRGPELLPAVAGSPVLVPQATNSAQVPTPVSAPPPPPQGATATFIESPMVGTFYAASAPDAPPFVSAGSQVRPDTIVCVIEAMKVFTEIPAGVSGTVVEVLVKNGQSVEFGQPLFRVEPA